MFNMSPQSNSNIKNLNEEKIIDFQKSNLHILNYSVPYQGKVKLAERKGRSFRPLTTKIGFPNL